MLASVKNVTRIIDAAESEVMRLAETPSPAAAIARVRLRMLNDIAFEHGATPSPDALERLAETFTAGVVARTLTESLARWLPLVGKMVDALAEARATHEIGWTAHAHLGALDRAALAALSSDEAPPVAPGEPSPPLSEDASVLRMVSRDPAPAIPPAALPDGRPNPELVSTAAGGTRMAVDELERRVAADPQNDELLSLLAYMYYSSNQLDRAVGTYRRALELNARNANAHYYLGNSHFKRGEYDDARRCWERAVELEPGSRMASNARRRAVAVMRISGDRT